MTTSILLVISIRGSGGSAGGSGSVAVGLVVVAMR